jgi:hypothetical protein
LACEPPIKISLSFHVAPGHDKGGLAIQQVLAVPQPRAAEAAAAPRADHRAKRDQK